jgi:hypothetical protein
MHVVRMRDTAKKRHDLMDKLVLAGARPQTTGRRDWLSDGTFDLSREDDAANEAP